MPMDAYLRYHLDEHINYEAEQRRVQRERFLPPTDEQVKRELKRRKEAKDGQTPNGG